MDISTPSASAGPRDKCSRCGFPRTEHSYNGACYSICGEFVSAGPQAEAANSTDGSREAVTRRILDAWRTRFPNNAYAWPAVPEEFASAAAKVCMAIYAHLQPQMADVVAWLCEYDGHTDATTDPDTVRIWRDTLGRKITPLGPQQADGRGETIQNAAEQSATADRASGSLPTVPPSEAIRSNGEPVLSADGRGAVIEDLRRELRKLAIKQHVRPATHSTFVSNGESCAVCKGEWVDGDPEHHALTCCAVPFALQQSPATDNALAIGAQERKCL